MCLQKLPWNDVFHRLDAHRRLDYFVVKKKSLRVETEPDLPMFGLCKPPPSAFCPATTIKRKLVTYTNVRMPGDDDSILYSNLSGICDAVRWVTGSAPHTRGPAWYVHNANL